MADNPDIHRTSSVGVPIVAAPTLRIVIGGVLPEAADDEVASASAPRAPGPGLRELAR
ncbi:hypothetical protein [Rhodococcus erythropolis]|uniref:hypothetical protein n=1 Tax=Rhodococcus erythropolis TaxID=1833 RepID=UPI0008CD187F|nr:hypothetical protein [Rhodococcus erythropolis]OFV78632.1 hypothetical protein RERY_07640 [Rhodococcus erythropolis]